MSTQLAGAADGLATTLIETKLVAPRSQAGLVERPRLHAKLDGFADRALILVDAPAGFGKTVMAQSWCATRTEAATAWVSLDAADNDAVRMWTHVATALDRVDGSVGGRALGRLRAPRARVEAAVDDLANGLASYGGQIDLVLDDLHLVGNTEALRPLDQLIERLPANSRLVVLTRADPPLRLARLRARRLLGEVRQRDLAFTTPEARELLVEREGIPLDDPDVERLVERTEGWPAGLCLAGLWLRGIADPSSAVLGFSGDHRHVAEYLASEVLDVLDVEHRQFLTRTSVFERFCASLCDAALERTDSADMLAGIVRSNGFVVGVDARDEWYRCHHLFRDVLLLELRRVEPTSIAGLHRRASAWFQGRGLVEEAVEHAGATGTTADVVRILRDDHMDLVATGRAATLIRWIGALPGDVLADAPELAGVAAIASGMLSRPAAERHQFLAAAERARVERPAAWSAYAAAAAAVARTAWIADDVGSAVAAGHEAVDLAAVAGDRVPVPALGTLSYALYLQGDSDGAVAASLQAIDHPTSARRTHGLMIALAVLALTEIEGGRPFNARQCAERAISVGREAGIADISAAGVAFVALAAVHAAEGRWVEAERDAERAELLRRGPDRTVLHAHALLVLAGIRMQRGRLTRAGADLDRARQEIDGFPDAGRLGPMADGLQRMLDAATSSASRPLVEPPTEAELLVLRLLATPLSQREIGEQLFLSVNTVKTHIRELYRKLGVQSREEAVARASEQGLTEDAWSPR